MVKVKLVSFEDGWVWVNINGERIQLAPHETRVIDVPEGTRISVDPAWVFRNINAREATAMEGLVLEIYHPVYVPERKPTEVLWWERAREEKLEEAAPAEEERKKVSSIFLILLILMLLAVGK